MRLRISPAANIFLVYLETTERVWWLQVILIITIYNLTLVCGMSTINKILLLLHTATAIVIIFTFYFEGRNTRLVMALKLTAAKSGVQLMYTITPSTSFTGTSRNSCINISIDIMISSTSSISCALRPEYK